ncbi:DMT family transporter [Aneurinibacillus tyrosinisolvens]|uniref:DMT family transporter n=1 Tax=Aneurinibacillus tyrosinisolvens TaxID=1443435 RepID=UPI00069C06A5|nr:DMT family transporter [Aneurinibacillus tyrosinisolvens]
MNAEKLLTGRFGLIATATFVCFLWGSAFPFIKMSYTLLSIQKNDTYAQILFAGYRFFIASLMLAGFLFIKERRAFFVRGSLPAIIQVGFFQTTLQYILFYIGLGYSTGIQGSIITGSGTFFSVLLAHYMYKNDRMNWHKTIGLTLGFFGVILASSTAGSFHLAFGLGEIALLIAAFSNSLGGILAKNKASTLNTVYLTCYQMLLGSLVLIIIGAAGAGWAPFHFNGTSLLYLLYLSFLSAAGFALWNTLLKFNKVGKVSMYFFLVPVFGVLLSTLLLAETLHSVVFISLFFVIGGIVIVNSEKEIVAVSAEKS